MSLLYPITASVGLVIGKIIDKYNFNKNKITPKQDMFIVFLIMFFGSILFLFLRGTEFPLLNRGLMRILLLLIIVSFIQNFFEFKGVAAKELSFREPISNLQPILTGFFAYLFFPTERELKYLIGIILGTIFIYWGHTQKRKLQIDKGTIYILFGVIFGALLSSIYKLGLEKITPEYLFLFRTGGTLFLLVIFGKIKFSGLNKKNTSMAIFAATLYLIASLLYLYSIQILGINQTILILFIGPALTYVLSHFILKEKISKKRVLTSVLLGILVIIMSII